MQDKFLNRLQEGISRGRLEPYLNGKRSLQESFGLYLWNVALCESLYPCLNSIEIALRNAIHDAASSNFGDEYWFLTRLFGKEKAIAHGVNKEPQEA